MIESILYIAKMLNKSEPFLKYLEKAARKSTVHGVPVLAAPKIHIAERIFWVLVIIWAIGAAVQISMINVKHYYESPTVISLKKDFRNWFNTFPSATCCFVNKADDDLLNEFIFEKWQMSENDTKYDYYKEFVVAVANVTYETLDQLDKFKDDVELNKLDLFDIAKAVHPFLTGTLVTFDTERNTKWTLIMTEKGICYTFNTKIAKYFTFSGSENLNNVSQNIIFEDTILSCHYLNGLCYARYDSHPLGALKVYVHSYIDIMHATSDAPLPIDAYQEVEINYLMQETYSGENIRYLNPSQRKCRFDDEPIDNYIPAYSTSICYMTCRYKLVMKLCGCKPFFYHQFPGKLCDLKGLSCVAKNSEHITSSPSKIGCVCPEPCIFISYIPQVPKVTTWEYGYFDERITFRWGLIPPTTKYQRDILFGFEDLVVSIGGTLALFLGVSFVSLIEMIYFTLDIMWSKLFPKKDGHYVKKTNQDSSRIKNVKMKEIQPNTEMVCPDCLLYLNVRNSTQNAIYPICTKHMSYRRRTNNTITSFMNNN